MESKMIKGDSGKQALLGSKDDESCWAMAF
jgi:hypothetical protein